MWKSIKIHEKLSLEFDIPKGSDEVVINVRNLFVEGLPLLTKERIPIQELKTDLFMSDYDRELVEKYVRAKEYLSSQYGWKRLMWLSEVQELIVTLDGKVGDRVYVFYGAIRGKPPSEYPEECRVATLFDILWRDERLRIRDGVLEQWLKENRAIADKYLRNMQIPPITTFHEDERIGITYGALFRAYAKKLEKKRA